jgi:hypothetical protein
MSTVAVAKVARGALAWTKARPSARTLVTFVVGMVLVAAVALRGWQLDHLPGVNGDEAWLGVQASRLAQGESIVWETPTGNPLNPFYLGPLALLHVAFAPSFTLLRSVAVASGVAALAVNYWFARRLFGERTAVIGTLLLAVMPINLAYSRLAWDASQSLLAVLPVMYCALAAAGEPQRWTTWILRACLATLVAVLVHPTNVFVAPLVALAAVHHRRTQIAAWVRRLLGRGSRASLDLADSAAAVSSSRRIAWGLVAAAMALAWALGPWLGIGLRRLAAPVEALQFAWNYLRLLSGTTVYRYVSGAIPYDPFNPPPVGSDLSIVDGLTLLVVGLGVFGCWQLVKARRAAADQCLLWGWLLSVVSFFLVAGPRAIGPHFERYSICLVGPSVLVLARGATWWLTRSDWRKPAAVVTLAAVVPSLLASFWCDFVVHLERTGGQSHRTFRTAAVEPKQQAWQIIDKARPRDAATTIVAEQWWNAWPLRYLASAAPNVKVVGWQELSAQERSHETLLQGNTWLAEFAGSRELDQARRRLGGLAGEEHTIADFAGNPLLVLLRPHR